MSPFTCHATTVKTEIYKHIKLLPCLITSTIFLTDYKNNFKLHSLISACTGILVFGAPQRRRFKSDVFEMTGDIVI